MLLLHQQTISALLFERFTLQRQSRAFSRQPVLVEYPDQWMLTSIIT
jgi:hypothetical protein